MYYIGYLYCIYLFYWILLHVTRVSVEKVTWRPVKFHGDFILTLHSSNPPLLLCNVQTARYPFLVCKMTNKVTIGIGNCGSTFEKNIEEKWRNFLNFS